MSEAEKEWLDRLEATVRQATGALESVRGERDELARRAEELEGRVAALEKELATARKAGGDGKGAAKDQAAGRKGAADAKAAREAQAAWQEERREIRRRVEALTERLEGLLDA